MSNVRMGIIGAGGISRLHAMAIATLDNVTLAGFCDRVFEAAKAKAEEEANREKERIERIEKKKKAKEQGSDENGEAALSQKEIARRKLAAARKRDAERYGEEYVDVTDDDVK